jgi:hypothetical protein
MLIDDANKTKTTRIKGSPLGQIKNVFLDRWPLKIDSIHMIFSMTRQEKGDL